MFVCVCVHMEAPKCQSLEITHLGCLVCFLREGLCNAHRDLPASGSPVLGLKVCTTMSGVILAFFGKGSPSLLEFIKYTRLVGKQAQ